MDGPDAAPDFPAGRADETFAPYRNLAAAVIAQAVKDARAGYMNARRFLAGGPPLRWWCQIAGLDAALIQERARRLARPGPKDATGARACNPTDRPNAPHNAL